MAKTVFEEMGGRYEKQGDYFLPLPYRTAQRRKADRRFRTAALAVFA